MMRFTAITAWFITLSMVLPLSSWSQITELVDIQLIEQTEATEIELTFSENAPKYKVTTITEGDISITTLTFQEATINAKFIIPILRPILHTEIIPPDQPGIDPLRILIYIEQKLELEHASLDNVIKAKYTWIPPNIGASPIIISSMTFKENDASSLTFDFNFEDSPADNYVFLSHDKKQIIGVFQNCDANNIQIKDPSQHNLVKKFTKQFEKSQSGSPSFKFIIFSDQEMSFDKTKEATHLFLIVYGFGQTDKYTAAVDQPRSEDPLSEDYIKPDKKGGAKWVYAGIGALGVIGIGGGVAWYLLSNTPGENGGPVNDGNIPPINESILPAEP